MPVENERKYILDLKFDAASLRDWEQHQIEQRYLDDGPRIRRFDDTYLFTYKRWIDKEGCLLEIEQEISEIDYRRLCGHCTESLIKTRYLRQIGDEEWVVDFLKAPDGVYFVLAEVEMPEGVGNPASLPAELSGRIVYSVDYNDTRFTNKKLSDPTYATQLYERLTDKTQEYKASFDTKTGDNI